ncbi:MAG: NUDIX domain-containing protein [Candidatus Methylacidiphilales bacterium]|nr:NUDIX domain-containing protein [Candidatus Methylacidiphilales bacterium]
MKDIFDIVDAQDEVVGRAPRSLVHRDGLLHRAAHIWLLRRNGEILIQLRSAAKDRHPRTWDSSACGHVDSGEDYPAAAARECCEELGLSRAPVLTEIAYCTDTRELDHEFVRLYSGLCEGPFRPKKDEVDELRWLLPEDLSAWVAREPEAFAPSFRHLWAKYRSLL